RDGHVTGVQTCALPISFCTARSNSSIPYSSGRTLATEPAPLGTNWIGAYHAPVQVWKLTPAAPASARPKSMPAAHRADANESDTSCAPPHVAVLISETRTATPPPATART